MSSVAPMMEYLRKRAAHLRGHQRINAWAAGYLERCLTSGTPVVLLTQMCVAVEAYRRVSEGRLVATKGERDLFTRELPEIAQTFRHYGFTIEWYVSLNVPYDDPARERSLSVFSDFRDFIVGLAQPHIDEGWLLVCDWEKDVLGRRQEPLPGFLERHAPLVTNEEVVERARLSEERAHPSQRSQKIEENKQWLLYRIGCEIAEGELLAAGKLISPELLIVPLLPPEKLRFYGRRAPAYHERIVDVLSHTPWR